MSLTGDGLLVRLRSTSIALLAGVAAIGLALVVVASQLGWPSVVSGPLPRAPRPGVVHNAAIVAPEPLAVSHRASHRRPSGGGRVPGRAAASPAVLAELTGASEVEAAPPQASPGPRHPSSPAPGHGTDGASPANSDPTPAPSPSTGQGSTDARPTADEDQAPVAAASEESPGHSGDSHGHQGGSGPPPWAGQGEAEGSPGDGSWDHGHDDHGGGWSRH